MPPPRVLVYTKPGCHLCDDMLDLLRSALRTRGVSVTERNIALDLDNFERQTRSGARHRRREVARHRIGEQRCWALDAAGSA
jgi:hypothetical protein